MNRIGVGICCITNSIVVVSISISTRTVIIIFAFLNNFCSTLITIITIITIITTGIDIITIILTRTACCFISFILRATVQFISETSASKSSFCN